MSQLGSTFLTVSLRRAGRFLALLGIALAAGHLAQTIAARHSARLTQSAPTAPVHIVTLSAGPDESGLTAALLAPKADQAAQPQPAVAMAASECTPVLHLKPEPGMMMEVTVAAPCDRGARVVLHHAGLAVTERLLADGTLAVRLPVMEAQARFDVSFDDGRTASAELTLPDLAGVRRFAVQWPGTAGFVLHGMENGADFGQEGDVSPHQPGIMATKGGWLSVLGDASVRNPLLAQIYTYPVDAVADVVVEAPVTAANCGKKLHGQTLSSQDGVAQVTNLTLAMPECSAVGDFLVLKNLAQNTKLAAK